MINQKQQSYIYILPLKNWVDWMRTRWEKKCPNLENFEKKGTKVRIHIIFWKISFKTYNVIMNKITRSLVNILK